jgi:NADPH-dependent curcumin reductase
LNARPAGNLTGEEFLWNEAPIPRPSDGQVLIRTLWLSVDPAQRIWMARDSYKPAVPLGDVMQSFAVGQVIESRHPDFKPGDLVRGDFSWQDYVVTDGKGFGAMQKVAPGTPPNLALSLFGVNGLTSYFGMIEIGKIKAGETVVVSGAAGATGSVAGQIAKIKGCRVIGTAGGKDKCVWLVNEAHFDATIDYKSEDVGVRLSALCPNGIDVFFDNVGGEVLNEVLARINLNARIVLCGSISKSDAATPQPGPANYSNSVRACRASTGLIIPREFPRPSRRWPAGIETAASRTGGSCLWPGECAESVAASVCWRELRKATPENCRCSCLGVDRDDPHALCLQTAFLNEALLDRHLRPEQT